MPDGQALHKRSSHDHHCTTHTGRGAAFRVEKIGWSVEGLPDGLTWEQALDLAQAVEREFTRSYLPEMAARLDEGDVGGAAREFLLHLGEDVD